MIEYCGDRRVARRYLGYFLDGDYKEAIQIEYRYAPCGQYSLFDLYTCIRGQAYYLREEPCFWQAVADLFEQLPLSSTIVVPHQVVVSNKGTLQIAMLEEQWYLAPPPGGDVAYQLRLFVNDHCFETPSRPSGFPATDFSIAAETLRREIPDEWVVQVCYFCKYLVECERNGGTDDRHDLLYCFRDSFLGREEELERLLKTAYPTAQTRYTLLPQATPDMDALHSCSAFVYRETQLL